jgi:hypothetical protein
VVLALFYYRQFFKLKNQFFVYVGCTYALALLYYSSFVLNSPGAHLRYFYPTLFLLQIVIIAVLASIIEKITTKKHEN